MSDMLERLPASSCIPSQGGTVTLLTDSEGRIIEITVHLKDPLAVRVGDKVTLNQVEVAIVP